MVTTNAGTDPTGGSGRVVVFDGRIDVAYGQFYVHGSDHDGDGDLSAGSVGQSNGLCGAADLGALWLLAGLHTGTVALTVQLLAAEPALDGEWEDVVEVSLPVEESAMFAIVSGRARASANPWFSTPVTIECATAPAIWMPGESSIPVTVPTLTFSKSGLQHILRIGS